MMHFRGYNSISNIMSGIPHEVVAVVQNHHVLDSHQTILMDELQKEETDEGKFRILGKGFNAEAIRAQAQLVSGRIQHINPLLTQGVSSKQSKTDGSLAVYRGNPGIRYSLPEKIANYYNRVVTTAHGFYVEIPPAALAIPYSSLDRQPDDKRCEAYGWTKFTWRDAVQLSVLSGIGTDEYLGDDKQVFSADEFGTGGVPFPLPPSKKRSRDDTNANDGDGTSNSSVCDVIFEIYIAGADIPHKVINVASVELAPEQVQVPSIRSLVYEGITVNIDRVLPHEAVTPLGNLTACGVPFFQLSRNFVVPTAIPASLKLANTATAIFKVPKPKKVTKVSANQMKVGDYFAKAPAPVLPQTMATSEPLSGTKEITTTQMSKPVQYSQIEKYVVTTKACSLKRLPFTHGMFYVNLNSVYVPESQHKPTTTT
jgi:hypothetical protein